MSEETGGDSGRPLEHLWNLQQVDTRLAAARPRRSGWWSKRVLGKG